MKNDVSLFGIVLNRATVVRWKIYIDRAKMYVSYISFIMIVFVFLNSFQDEGIRNILDNNKLIVYPSILVIFVVISLLLGRLDTKLGMRKEELRNHASENPVTMEILNSLKEIKKNQENLISVNKIE